MLDDRAFDWIIWAYSCGVMSFCSTLISELDAKSWCMSVFCHNEARTGLRTSRIKLGNFLLSLKVICTVLPVRFNVRKSLMLTAPTGAWVYD